MSYTDEVLSVLQEAELMYADTPVMWHVVGHDVTFYMVCSDTFAWGCADAEQIEPGDVELLRQTIADLKTAVPAGEIWTGILFCARKRGMRPMNRWLKREREREDMTDAVYNLFCATGPERESVFGAP